MFSVLQTLVPPSCVEHAVEAHFTSSSDLNIIVGLASFLQVYRIVEDPLDGDRAALQLVVEKRLFGHIESIATFRAPGWPRDLIVVSFRDAKVTVLQFDITTNDIAVVSMHYFET
jgi:cleavage and polyadenylation specificity factor subunit 1